MTERKVWVTIKIPERIRDDAKEDPRTYGEIMTAGLDGTPVESGEIEAAGLVALEDRVDEVGGILEKIQNDWEYLNGEETHGGVHESEHQLRDVLDRLDRIESAAKEATNAAQSADRKLDNMGGM